MKVTKEYIEKTISELDKELSKKDDAFKPACILLSSAFVGADNKKISELLKIPVDEIKPLEKRLRASKVWIKDKVNADWDDKKNGGVAFWCDVGVAQGFIKRA